ncbi:hypothetical protein CC86DRAFT_241953, partial [Ophiobolus disseminans]
SWRFGIITGAVCSFLVFVLNLSLTIWAVSTHAVRDGQTIVFEGSCMTSKQLNVMIHLVVNILGTILLGASNYCMQCLSAPTRLEVDKAHANMTWLDIGVPSFRYLTRISRKRSILWVCVALSSMPLHLFYNSVLYASVAANEYQAFVLSDKMIHWNSTIDVPQRFPGAKPFVDDARAGRLKNLTRAECIKAYGHTFEASHGSVLLIVNFETESLDYVWYNIDLTIRPGCDKSGWVCGGNSTACSGCTRQEITNFKNQNGWIVGNNRVEYCLSQRTEEKCKIHLNVAIAVLVTTTNMLKVLLFTFIAWRIREDPLMTVGDAVASFMERPDPTTEGMCLMSRADFENDDELWQRGTGPRFYYSKPKRWFKAASKKRWTSIILLYCSALFICTFFALMSFSEIDYRNPTLGTVTLSSLTTKSGGIIGNALKANISQMILSLIYVAYNALLTSLLLSKEWNQYTRQRKGLRVSARPKGEQRSTYFLQLPYRYSIPLLILSGTFHWLVSQTIYLVSIEVYHASDALPPNHSVMYTHNTTHHPERDILTTGFSALGLFAVIGLAFIALLVLIILSRRRFASGIPVAGSCSASISAACHPVDPEPENAPELQLQWGVSREPSNNRGVGHCSFSSRPVGVPV